jgi:hypothetical protein
MPLPNEAAPTALPNRPNESAPAAPASAPVTAQGQAPAPAPAPLQSAAAPAQAPAPVNPVSDAASKLVASGVKSIREAIDKSSNPGLYEELINMSDDQLAEVERQFAEQTGKSSTGTPQAGTPSPAAAPAAAPGAPAPDDDREETITLKRSELGTYASKDRSTKDAILELIKGKKKADEVIDYTNKKRIPAMEKVGAQLVAENSRLKQELEGFKVRAPAAPAAPAAADSIVIPAVPNVDEYDMFDPASKQAYNDALKARDDAITKRHQAEVEALRIPKPPAAQPEQTSGITDAVEREYNEIDLFQANPETEGIFITKKPVGDVEKDYISFVDNLAKLHKIGAVYDAAGRFMPAVSTLIGQYFNQESEEGKTVRAAAEAAGLKAPEDIQPLFRIYSIRNIRSQYQRPNKITGAVEPISYEEAFELDRKLHPDAYKASGTPQSQAPAGTASSAIERGVQHRQQFAPEVPATMGVPVQAHESVAVEEFFRLMKKPMGSYSPEEETRLRGLMKSEAKMDDEEINAYFTKPQPI